MNEPEQAFKFEDKVPLFFNGDHLQKVNNRPIIGVLSQPLLKHDRENPEFKGYASYIMKNYITFLESAGARVVPLIWDGDIQA